jgi:hypothetical protein
MTKHIFPLCLAAALALGGLQSCHKENNSAPKISRLRADLATPNDSTLSFVNPGQYVILDGMGFASTRQVLFDGIPGAYNAALVADQHLVIQVPTIPPDVLNGAKANTIEVITAGGSITYTFPVNPPAPLVAAISNEFAHPGDVITITGQYLYLVQSVTFPGGIAAPNYTTNSDGSSMTVTVPAGATTGGGIIITSKGGTSSSEPAAGFWDTRGMLCDFDTYNQYSWGATNIIDSPSFTGNNGNFAQLSFTGVNAGDGSWWNGGRSLNTNGVQWVAADSMSNPLSDYAMKFEIYVKQPWTTGAFYVVPNYTWTYLATYSGWQAFSDSTMISTNQWSTVVIPLTNFQTNTGAGSPPSSLGALLGGGNQSIDIMFVNNGTKPVATFDAGIDNIRVVKVH